MSTSTGDSLARSPSYRPATAPRSRSAAVVTHGYGRSMTTAASLGLTKTGFRLVLVITGLSVCHHVDHVLRGVTGWPLAGGFNPFTMSLLVYPAVVAGLVLSRKGRAGPRFWAALAGGGALFILVVHIGPAAGDSVASISDQYASPVADGAALVVLAAFFAALVAHCLYEARLPARTSRESETSDR